MHPLEILQGYRLGGHQATVELGAPIIHIDFDVLKLVEDIQAGKVKAVILTGTAGDGKTYLAYRVIGALELDRTTVAAAQAEGGYDQGGTYIDLDLSAGPLTDARVRRLHQVLSTPGRLTLVCANEGKLSELEERFRSASLDIPQTPLRINLSRRALVSPKAWDKVRRGVLDAPFWGEADLSKTHIMTRNRAWLQDSTVMENVRRYLLLPYLLGEPITVREVLSFLAYSLTGDLTLEEAEQMSKDERRVLPYFLFNTLFSEPGGYVHGGRAVPAEKLLWWMFRFDPGATANPQADLQLLTQLDQLDVAPPDELLDYWHSETVVQPEERSDTKYRRRVATFMNYARRWYALFSEVGHSAYFPFRHFDDYVDALLTPFENLDDEVPTLIKGLNLLLSGGQVEEKYDLNLYHVSDMGIAHRSVIYSRTQVPSHRFWLVSDLKLGDMTGDAYLERHPRQLYLCYPADAEPDDQIRLPISLLLYEVLRGAASPESGFPATLWAKERYIVTRFMGALNRLAKKRPVAQFIISVGTDEKLKLAHDPKARNIDVL
ncbi:MAG: hypothetical protein E3J21_26325 [Anaerolineales bacterium]|nr:MAG: hypothetical protein E3J21_26325 [Anaerolineales bacterium]